MQQMLKEIGESIAAYIPNLVGALVILVIGWIIALVLSAVVRGVLRRTKLDTKLANWVPVKDGEEVPDVAGGIGRVTFWLLMILVLLAFFEALRLTLMENPHVYLSLFQ